MPCNASLEITENCAFVHGLILKACTRSVRPGWHHWQLILKGKKLCDEKMQYEWVYPLCRPLCSECIDRWVVAEGLVILILGLGLQSWIIIDFAVTLLTSERHLLPLKTLITEDPHYKNGNLSGRPWICGLFRITTIPDKNSCIKFRKFLLITF